MYPLTLLISIDFTAVCSKRVQAPNNAFPASTWDFAFPVSAPNPVTAVNAPPCYDANNTEPRYYHLKTLRCDLHWLPINARVDFNICVLIFKCLNGVAPAYLSNLISIKLQGI